MNMHAASGICTHGVSNVGGVTAGPARLNSSNVGCHCGPDGTRARRDTSLEYLTLVKKQSKLDTC